MKTKQVHNHLLIAMIRAFCALLLILSVGLLIIHYGVPGHLSEIAANFAWPSLFLFVIALLSTQIVRVIVFRLDQEIIFMSDSPVFSSQVLRLSYYGPSEFPKRSLLSYEIKKKGFRTTLIVKTSSSSQDVRTRKLDISFLRSSKRKRIINILEEVLKENKK